MFFNEVFGDLKSIRVIFVRSNISLFNSTQIALLYALFVFTKPLRNMHIVVLFVIVKNRLITLC